MKKKFSIRRKIIFILLIVFVISNLILIPYVLKKLSTIEDETLAKTVSSFKKMFVYFTSLFNAITNIAPMEHDHDLPINTHLF